MAFTCEVVFPQACETVFDLVADVERYPEFVPHWRAARVVARHGDGSYETLQAVSFGPVSQKFHTLTTVERPRRLTIKALKGPFRAFFIDWRFSPMGAESGGGCRVALRFEVDMKAGPMQRLVDHAIGQMSHQMIEAFRRRAALL
ncbi:type II toxin-antitoxin system RatA family toxin [Roseospirillum parvum]|uniref:Coenzyme Q-binding protein COQ10 n=1 Tax=Roseospirillum parvum TaxID=83401 RepID=A0A1G8B415_9PROT|nr:type II toxin-antitoxin system RatA family toxin [Roseospirillum parvum]SDH27875.1 coenzyme Q-binding protein COQ10 [Roseospirillum parvum]